MVSSVFALSLYICMNSLLCDLDSSFINHERCVESVDSCRPRAGPMSTPDPRAVYVLPGGAGVRAAGVGSLCSCSALAVLLQEAL